MRIGLFDYKEFIDLNHLSEVTSPSLYERNSLPHPNGLISNEIFGISTKSRKETFAYIDLHNYYFTPHVYSRLLRIFRNIDNIVAGTDRYSIDKDGHLVKDPEGETGIEFLYNNWEKIKWEKNEGHGLHNEVVDLITKHKKNEIFTHYEIVLPAYYRDIKTKRNGSGETDDINKLYSKLIRYSSLIESQYLFDFNFHNTNWNIQHTLVDIYIYFRDKIKGKNGLMRKYLLGKNVDYCTRTVITAETFHDDRPDEMEISYEYSSVPISQACVLCYPFVVKYVTDFFKRELDDNKNSKIVYDPETDTVTDVKELDSPISFFNDRYIKKMIDTFIKDPESRFDKIEVPVKNTNKKMYLAFTGIRYTGSTSAELSSISNRPMCWTDLLYLACCDVTKDKHIIGTRYPILDEFASFVTKIRISSTIKTVPMLIDGQLYKYYPLIDYFIPTERIGSYFIDSVRFSNSYLTGLDKLISVEDKPL